MIPMARIRFSIQTAILLTTIAALATTVALLWREIGPLRAEVRRLRMETGQLTVDDPRKIYAISVNSPPAAPNAWKWRFYLPPGRQYWLHTIVGLVSDKGYDNDNGFKSSTVLDCGEHVLEIAVAKNDDGEW